MPEFKKKTALGLRDVPDGEKSREYTHVILTRGEYGGLLAKITEAEVMAGKSYSEARKKAEQASINASYAVNRAKAEADAAISAMQGELENANSRIDYLEGLNQNLLRIARERANADRRLKPKKKHTGYVVLSSAEKECRCKTRKAIITAKLWETVLQSPYSIEFTEEQVRTQTAELMQPDENGTIALNRIGITAQYNGDYEALLCDRFWSSEQKENLNIMLKHSLRANYRTGYWEIIFRHTKPLGLVPEDMRR